jgi:hypothetical protein
VKDATVESEKCGICGGDGRISNSFSGSDARCPACLGSGRRSDGGGYRDVTKTKPSHHQPNKHAAPAVKQTDPTTFAGIELAKEVEANAHISSDTKAKLRREIMAYEASHGSCTKTFIRKVRKQLSAAAPR